MDFLAIKARSAKVVLVLSEPANLQTSITLKKFADMPHDDPIIGDIYLLLIISYCGSL